MTSSRFVLSPTEVLGIHEINGIQNFLFPFALVYCVLAGLESSGRLVGSSYCLCRSGTRGVVGLSFVAFFDLGDLGSKGNSYPEVYGKGGAVPAGRERVHGSSPAGGDL